MTIKSFEVVNNFIQEIFGVEFLGKNLDHRITQYGELMKARTAILNIARNGWQQKSRYMEDIFPLLEVALQWNDLKTSGKLDNEFLEKCRTRMIASASNFLGVIFEIDMATRCRLSGWDCIFLEAQKKNETKIIDLLIKKPNGKNLGLECESKRATEGLEVNKINETLSEKSQKFSEESLKSIQIKLDKKVVIIDVTRKNHEKPASLLEDLNEIILPEELDGAVLTWRQCLGDEERQSLPIKYKAVGNNKRRILHHYVVCRIIFAK